MEEILKVLLRVLGPTLGAIVVALLVIDRWVKPIFRRGNPGSQDTGVAQKLLEQAFETSEEVDLERHKELTGMVKEVAADLKTCTTSIQTVLTNHEARIRVVEDRTK